jgi:hypothetical protein
MKITDKNIEDVLSLIERNDIQTAIVMLRSLALHYRLNPIYDKDSKNFWPSVTS